MSIPASLRDFTAELALELSHPYDDNVVYPGETVVDEPGSEDSPFPGWETPVLVLATENQGVCAWGVPLDGDDNPPVLVGGELDGHEGTVVYAADVAAYVAARRWDRRALSVEPLLQAQAEPVDEETLAHLRSRYDQLPSTSGWPGGTQYRFERAGVRILLWAAGDQCDWWISGDADRLADAAKALLPYSNLREALWSNDQPGQDLVDRLTA